MEADSSLGIHQGILACLCIEKHEVNGEECRLMDNGAERLMVTTNALSPVTDELCSRRWHCLCRALRSIAFAYSSQTTEVDYFIKCPLYLLKLSF